MNVNENNFINIVKSIIKNEAIALTDPMNWEEIFEIALNHSLVSFIYPAVKDCKDIPDLVIKKYRDIFLAQFSYTTKQEYYINKLKRIFNKNKIEFCFFKGSDVRQYYPMTEGRTMGDADVLINFTDRDKVDKLLLSEGFSFIEHESEKYVRNYKINDFLFEIHTNLMYGEGFNDVDYTKYYEDCFKHSHLLENCQRELDKSYHLVFLIVHMAKHFHQEGCGIRMLLDIPFFVLKNQDELDKERIFKDLDKLNLTLFANNMFYLCNKWFDLNLFDIKYKMNNNLYDKLCKYIFDGGTFGHSDEGRIGGVKIRRTYKYSKNPVVNYLRKIKGFLMWVFPSYEYMKKRSVWFENKPAVLLPIAWINRLILALQNRRNSALNDLNLTINSMSSIDEEYKFLYELGIK